MDKETETLSFKIALSATRWQRDPLYSIYLDGQKITSELIAESNTPAVIEFSKTVCEGEHSLDIRLENKTSEDTKIVDGKIVEDMLLNIDDIEIDNISLDQLLWSAEYILDEPQEYMGEKIEHLDHCVNLGWNGTYRLKFTSPFYIWLLERL